MKFFFGSIVNEHYQTTNPLASFNMTESRVWNNAMPPNDALFNKQWAFDNKANNADINMQEGWQKYRSVTANSQNGNEVIIAVIDSGVDYLHPDLEKIIWTNPGEIAGDGIDNDQNGYIDDVHGWDFTQEDKSHLGYKKGDPMDTNGHGTHVAGIIYSEPNGGGEMGAGVTSYTNGKVIY